MSRPRADRLELVEQFGEVVAFVEANPGASANMIARAVRARRNVALALLKLGRAGGVLRAEPRPRRSSAWFVADERPHWYPCREAGGCMTFEVPVDDRLPLALWTVLIKFRAGWRCEACGAEPQGRGRSLHAHHVDRDSLNHRLSNGRALCSRCHADVHNALRVGVVDRFPNRESGNSGDGNAPETAQQCETDPKPANRDVAFWVGRRPSEGGRFPSSYTQDLGARG